MYQVWFSINDRPIETEADREEFARLSENWSQPLGFGHVDGDGKCSHIFRCQTSDFEPIFDFLNSIGKEPIVIGAKDQSGNWVMTVNGDGTTGELYPHDDELYWLHMKATDTEGNEVFAVGNTSAGWADYADQTPKIVEKEILEDISEEII